MSEICFKIIQSEWWGTDETGLSRSWQLFEAGWWIYGGEIILSSLLLMFEILHNNLLLILDRERETSMWNTLMGCLCTHPARSWTCKLGIICAPTSNQTGDLPVDDTPTQSHQPGLHNFLIKDCEIRLQWHCPYSQKNHLLKVPL